MALISLIIYDTYITYCLFPLELDLEFLVPEESWCLHANVDI